MKRLAGYTAVVLATLSTLLLVWQFRSIVVLFILSLFVAAAVRPLINQFVAWKLPTFIAQPLVYLIGLAFLGFLLYIVSTSLLTEVETLSQVLTWQYERSYSQWQQGSAWQQAIAQQLPPPAQLFEQVAGSGGYVLLQTLLGITQGIFGALANLVIILILSIYWSANQNHFERLWLSLLPVEQRIRAREGWRATEIAMGSYIRSETVQSFLAALLLGLGYRLMELDYPILLALVGAIAWFIPLVGILFIAGPTLLLGLLEGWEPAVAAVLYTVIIFLFLEFVVEPRFFNRRRYSSVLILLTMIPLADIYGLAGLIAAPPLAVAIQVLGGHLFYYYAQPRDTAGQLAYLGDRYSKVRTRFENPAVGSPPAELNSILERLSRLIERTAEL